MMSGTVGPTGCRRRTNRHALNPPAAGRSTLVALLALLGAGLLLLLGGGAIVLLILGYGHEAMSGVLPLLMVLLAAAVLPGPGRAGTRR